MTAGDHGSTPRTTSLWRSFGHAWDGLADAARGQRNMRIHFVAGILAGAFAASAQLETVERALIVLCIALVIAAEAFNTSLEAVVDLQRAPPSEVARIAKDAAAGAVLVFAAASVAMFGLIAARHWQEVIAGWRLLLPSGLAAVPLGAIAWRLASPEPLRHAGVTGLAVVGALLLALLAAVSNSAIAAAVPALLFAIAVSARLRAAKPAARAR